MTGLACNFLALKELGKDGDKPCSAPTFFSTLFPLRLASNPTCADLQGGGHGVPEGATRV